MTALPSDLFRRPACPVCGEASAVCVGHESTRAAAVRVFDALGGIEPMGNLAKERTVIDNPNVPGAGFVVAAGDPLPDDYAGPYVENSPNTADAASNDPDAADQAQTSTPATRVVSGFGSVGAAAAAAENADGDAESGYASMKVDELRAEAEKRDLEVASGARKADLIAALEEDDEAES